MGRAGASLAHRVFDSQPELHDGRASVRWRDPPGGAYSPAQTASQ